MNREQIAKIIELLEESRKRPPLYIGGYDVNAAWHFCNGVEAACWAFGEKGHSPLRRQIVQERGWNSDTAQHFSHEMKQCGLTQQAMVEELFDVEIEVWRRVAQELEQ